MKKESKYLIIFSFIIVLSFSINTVFNYHVIDKDIFYTLNQGRYILNNGLYHIDPFSLHEGFKIVVQNYLYSIILYKVYHATSYLFLNIGLVFLMLIIHLLFIRVNYLISKNLNLSILLATFTSVLFSLNGLILRAHIISFILLLLLMVFLEKYILDKKKKHLYFIPLLSLISINMHASLWLYIPIIISTYIMASFHIKNKKIELDYPIKNLCIVLILSILVAFINPYGLDMLLFLFRSSSPYMTDLIAELRPYTFSAYPLFLILFYLVIVIYLLRRDLDIKRRFLYLFLGTSLLSFMHFKGILHFIILGSFTLTYSFKNYKLHLKYMPLCLVVAFFLLGFVLIQPREKLLLTHELKPLVDELDKHAKKGEHIFTGFDEGGYVNYRGYKSYIDSRAEVYLKSNNQKEDIFKEYYDLVKDKLDYKKFLTKYHFKYLVIDKKDKLQNYLDNYDIIYKDKKYTLYKEKDYASSRNAQ